MAKQSDIAQHHRVARMSFSGGSGVNDLSTTKRRVNWVSAGVNTAAFGAAANTSELIPPGSALASAGPPVVQGQGIVANRTFGYFTVLEDGIYDVRYSLNAVSLTVTDTITFDVGASLTTADGQADAATNLVAIQGSQCTILPGTAAGSQNVQGNVNGVYLQQGTVVAVCATSSGTGDATWVSGSFSVERKA